VDDLLDHKLVNRIFKGIKKAYGYGFHTHAHERPHGFYRIVGIKGPQDRSVAPYPFVHLEAVSSRNQGLREFRKYIVGRITNLTTDLQDVSETLCRDEARSRSFSFDY